MGALYLLAIGPHGFAGHRPGFFFPFFFGLPLLVVLVAGAGLLFLIFARRGRDATTPATPAGPADDRALAILRERFARSEITPEEYHERRRILTGEADGSET